MVASITHCATEEPYLVGKSACVNSLSPSTSHITTVRKSGSTHGSIVRRSVAMSFAQCVCRSPAG